MLADKTNVVASRIPDREAIIKVDHRSFWAQGNDA